MKRLIVMALAVILGVFVLNAVSTASSQAAPAVAAAGISQSVPAGETGVTKIWWRGGGWRGGWGPGWGWAAAPYYGWGPGWGPYCRWRCGPYRCWRVCY